MHYLKEVGINPYEMDVDLPSMYILQNYDNLLEAARNEGKAAEAARVANVEAHASKPNSETGKAPGAQGQVSTVKGLDDFFKSL